MAQYGTQTNFASPATNDTAVHLKCSATVRAALCELILSSTATPTEQNGDYSVVRTTTAGTTPVATLTVVKADPFHSANGVTAEGNGYTTEPTVGETIMRFAVHQKAIYRWVAYPGRELRSTASANNGLGLVVLSQSAAHALDASVAWLE